MVLIYILIIKKTTRIEIDWFTNLNLLLQTRTRTSQVTNCYGNIRELTVKYGACAIKRVNTAHAQAHCTSDSSKHNQYMHWY